ncbi:hypothetical protein JG688_00017025, partial [Phytophthora aleatoria]
GVQDRYFRYEAAGDQYLGRVVAGLPQYSSQFAVLPPHFDDRGNSIVRDCTDLIFPSTKDNAHIAQVLILCVASLVVHAEFL